MPGASISSIYRTTDDQIVLADLRNKLAALGVPTDNLTVSFIYRFCIRFVNSHMDHDGRFICPNCSQDRSDAP